MNVGFYMWLYFSFSALFKFLVVGSAIYIGFVTLCCGLSESNINFIDSLKSWCVKEMGYVFIICSMLLCFVPERKDLTYIIMAQVAYDAVNSETGEKAVDVFNVMLDRYLSEVNKGG